MLGRRLVGWNVLRSDRLAMFGVFAAIARASRNVSPGETWRTSISVSRSGASLASTTMLFTPSRSM